MVAAKSTDGALSISAPKFQILTVRVIGAAPYMQARFSEKAKQAMRDKMEAGSTAKKGKREARDFEADFQASMHRTADGEFGIPAPAFRNAMIDACRMVGYPMTKAKMSVFVLADEIDAIDGTPLVLIEGTPEKSEMMTRNATGVADIRVRGLWRKWACDLTLRFDADQFTAEEVINLLARAGVQVGIGEGRPFSKQSNGMGFGVFDIERRTVQIQEGIDF